MDKNNYLSTAKAIGIVLMVVGHAISQNFACRFIYMFHMPLFFFCFGYFYVVPSSLEEVSRFVIKRIKGLYWPFVKWGVVLLLFHNYFCDWHLYDSSITNYSSSYFLYRFKLLTLSMTGQEQLLAPLWFLKALLLSSVFLCFITFLLHGIVNKYKDLLLFFLFIILTVLTKYNQLSLAPPVIDDFSLIFMSMTFIFAGHFYRKIEKQYSYSYSGFLISFTIVFFITWICQDYLDMLWYTETEVLLYVPTAIVGVYMVFSISYLIERYSVKCLFHYLGQNILIILVLHLFVFKLGNWLKICIYDLPIKIIADFKIIYENNEYFWIVYSIIGCVLPILISILIKVCNNYCLGIQWRGKRLL